MLENSVLSSIVPYGPPEGVSAGTAVPNTSPDSWTGTGSAATLPASIAWGNQSTLPDGRVVVTGGRGTNGAGGSVNAYIYTLSTNTWYEVASIPSIAAHHGQSTLLDGRVLISGGQYLGESNWVQVNDSYIYSPNSDIWVSASPMPRSLLGHGQSTLNDGRVLTSGGYNSASGNIKSVYVYNSVNNAWTSVDSMPTDFNAHGQSTLLDGKVLVSGGLEDGIISVKPTYVYTPTGIGSWIETSPLPTAFHEHKQSTLADGNVLVSGGFNTSINGNINTVYIYNSGNNAWTSAASLAIACRSHNQSVLADGRVLISGGAGGEKNAYIYTPTGWVAVGRKTTKNIRICRKYYVKFVHNFTKKR